LTRTFIDSGVLIVAATGRDVLLVRALAVLYAPDREFITNVFVRRKYCPNLHRFLLPSGKSLHADKGILLEETMKSRFLLYGHGDVE